MWSRFKVKKINVSSNPNGGIDNPGLYLGPGDDPKTNGATGPRRADRNSISVITLEALPKLDYYTNAQDSAKRPSLGQLHGEPPYTKSEDYKPDPYDQGGHGHKLGWIQGVLIPVLLNIWGVMLFLRLSWVVGQSGILGTLIIILISLIVCVITTLSLSAISTNGELKGGGVYYMISRSLGPEFGASIGIIFAFANAVAAAMNTIGFCDSLNSLLASLGTKIVDGDVNDVRIVGLIALVIMTIICAVGMEWEAKAQNVLVVIIVAAIANFLTGAAIGPRSDEQLGKGFTGFSITSLHNNWLGDYRYSEGVNQTFFSVFGIFFPSVTGIQAGANIAGDLKDPAGAIPKGTFLALFLSMFSYAVFVVFAGGAAVRDADGNANHTLSGDLPCLSNYSCQYGLLNDYTVMQLMSGWDGLIYAGCFAATLSTALTNILSVPRLVQGLGFDQVLPGLHFFAKGYGKSKEPYRGYVLTFLIAAAFIIIADLNAIAPLISNFYLASYALINFCTFHAELIKPLGWRPRFKYYNMWVSLIGFFLCVVIMFLIDWVSSLITYGVLFILYVWVSYRKPEANWGSSTDAQVYKTALLTVQKLAQSNDHVKNYRPQLLVLTGPPHCRPTLVDLGNLIAKNNSLLMCAEISKERLLYRTRMQKIEAGTDWLGKHKIKGFFNLVEGMKPEDGAKALMQASGVGKLRPNVVLMGYKGDWQTCSFDSLQSYFNILHDAFANRLAVTILRIPGGLDYLNESSRPEAIPEEIGGSLSDLTVSNGLRHADSNLNVLSQTSLTLNSNAKSDRPSILPSPSDFLKSKKKNNIVHKFPDGVEINKTVLENLRVFDKKYKSGYIDVWWLYDDGGLTILLPYILANRNIFSGCKIRIFALANRHNSLEEEGRNMANLLSKFRIKYESLTMINDIMNEPRKETTEMFNEVIRGFKQPDSEYVVTDGELQNLKEKTDRQLRLRELLLQHSKDCTLVVMSLPMPRKGVVSAPLYMAWLEAITKDMPPFLLVRGNQMSVLTFYS